MSPIDTLFAKKVAPTAPEKASLFLAYLLQAAREGHLCVSLSSDLDPDVQEGANLLPSSLFDHVLVRHENRIYLRRNWECEHQFLTHFRRLCSSPPSVQVHLKNLEKQGLNGEQQAAIQKAASQAVTLIVGGPGTGKTYTAAVLIRLFLEGGIRKVVVAAPTGKATANIRSALGDLSEVCVVSTLQSLVGKEQLFADLILVDEGSMVDAELMASVFQAVRGGSRLVLLGDKDQLPPVESGHFFADLAEDPSLTAELKTCLRAELQEIIDLAQAVKRGEVIPYHPLPDVKAIVQQIIERPVHVLTPLRRGPYGSDHLNQLLYRAHQQRGVKEIPIMVTVNDPNLGLYNGDVGTWVKDEGRAFFSGGRSFPEYLLPAYEYAYVLSVHKSQGSEYDRVMILLPEGSERFGREMLYTALTRAKKEISLYAHPGTLESLIHTRSHRSSGLKSQS